MNAQNCYSCKEKPSGKGVIAGDNYFHNACFKCCQCGSSLIGGKPYVIQDGGYYCLSDYNKRWGVRCTGCGQYCTDRFLRTASGSSYHHACVKCHDCGASLDSPSFEHDSKFYCHTHYQKRWGKKCKSCQKYIDDPRMVTAAGNVYHHSCIKCNWCETLLSPPARYYSSGDQLLCQSCHQLMTESRQSVPKLPSAVASSSKTTVGQRVTSLGPSGITVQGGNGSYTNVNPDGVTVVMDGDQIPFGVKLRPTGTQFKGPAQQLQNNEGWRQQSMTNLTSNVQPVPSAPPMKIPRVSSGKAKPRAPQPPVVFPPPSQSVSIETNGSVSECTICFESGVDSVFIPCGHMCICHKCAEEYRKNKPNAVCPICRAPSTGIFRTYAA